MKKKKSLFSLTRNITRNKFGRIFPLIYIGMLLLGFLLFLSFKIFPVLVYCSSLFGTKFCTPTGTFISLVASLPGYYFAGNLFGVNPKTPITISIPIVFVFSLVFYHILGFLIDILRTVKIKNDQLTKYLIVVIFILLFILYLSFL